MSEQATKNESLFFERYARHLVLPEVGVSGQRRLASSSVLCVGAGGLGSPVSLYLAAAGVGKIGLIDFDVVDRTNLQRQILYSDNDVGRVKVVCASDRIRALNPEIEVEMHQTRLTSENAMEIIAKYDVIVDGSDNFATRYLVNDACVLLGKPNVYGSVFRFEGQASVFNPPAAPCYRCLFPLPPPPEDAPNCAEAGVLGVIPGIIGCIQATEALKLLLDLGDTLEGRLLHLDALRMQMNTFEIARNESCMVCGVSPSITKLIEERVVCEAEGDKKPMQSELKITQMSVQQLKEMRDNGSQFTLLDVREAHELEISKLEPCIHIPMGQVMARLSELDLDAEIAVLCRSGRRSNDIAAVLLKSGFTKVSNVAGGINAYAEQIDRSIRTY